MKKVVLGVVLALVATSAFAGAIYDPVIEREVIVQQTAASSFNHAVIPPLFFLFFLGLGLIL